MRGVVKWTGTTEYETGPGDASTSSGALTETPCKEGVRLMANSTSSSPSESIPLEYIDQYDIDPETGAVLIPVYSKAHPGRFALVDQSDVHLVAGRSWTLMHPNRTWYARSEGRRSEGEPKAFLMHRLIMGVSDRWQLVDHINHDGLDNRRCNLRIVTMQQNLFNQKPSRKSSSQYKGVSARGRRWAASIMVAGVVYYLGTFETEIQAARAYDAEARKHHGEYGYFNFPDESGVA